MNKSIYTLALLLSLCFSTASFAQVEINAGIGVSRFLGIDDGANKKVCVDYKLGVGYIHSLSDKLAVEAMGGIAKRGDADSHITYLDVPLTVNYSFAKDLEVDFGPYVAYGIGGDSKYIKDVIDASPTVFDLYKHWDAGAIVRLKANASSHMYIGIDLTYGFMNINRATSSNHNASAGLVVGYRL